MWVCFTFGVLTESVRAPLMDWKAPLVSSGSSEPSLMPTTASNLVGASAILLLSSAPRFAKGPVPKVLSLTASAGAVYYGNILYKLRG